MQISPFLQKNKKDVDKVTPFAINLKLWVFSHLVGDINDCMQTIPCEIIMLWLRDTVTYIDIDIMRTA